MPLYMCSGVRGVIPEGAKAKIAADITDAHCDVTGMSRANVHVFFFEDAPQLPVKGRSVFFFGHIKAGYSVLQKTDLLIRIKASVFTCAGVSPKEIIADITDVPATWVMEGSEVLSETQRRPV